MRKSALLLTAALIMLARPAFAEEAAGTWRGAIDNHLLSLVHIEKKADGYNGTFEDHEQPVNASDAHTINPLSHIEATPDHLAFEVPMIGGYFDGTWSETDQQWIGTFQWGKDGYKSQLSLKRTDATTLAAAFADRQPRTYASPAEEAAEMEKLIDVYMKDERFMGSILVSHNGHTLIDRGYGFANLTGKTPNAPDTRYHIGSITKPLTATAILILQEHGKLSIDDPVGKYIPNAPAIWDKITLRHLLTHTSGLGDYLPSLNGRYGQAFTPEQLVEVIRALPLDFQPGEKFQYSNAGFILLGAVIERASGQTYGDFMQQNIFTPLHMADTGYDLPDGPHSAIGYEPGVEAPRAADRWNLSVAYSAGGLVSTTHDLRTFSEALFDGKLLPQASLKTMTDSSLGIGKINADGHTAYTHGGRVPGFVNGLTYAPDDRLAVVVLGNLDNGTPALLGPSLTTIAHGLSAVVVLPPKAIVLAPDILAQYAGTYVLMPDFNLVVTVENGQLIVQATGQPKISAYAESETIFFAKIVEAKLEFVRDKDGKLSCILHQGGRDIPGVRQ